MTVGMISYLRVSTNHQGKSGLGLEAQREAIQRFAEAEGLTVSSEFIEVESGKGADALTEGPSSPRPWPWLAVRRVRSS